MNAFPSLSIVGGPPTDRARAVLPFGPVSEVAPDPLTSLVLPAYNPGPAILETWHRVRDFLRSAPGPWEALFVLDGCTDGTAERLAPLMRQTDLPIRVLGYPRNKGKGHAVRVGLLAAAGRWRVFTDVDLAYPFADVERLAVALRTGAPVAIGARCHPDSEVTLPAGLLGYAFRRHFQSRAFGWVARQLLPVRFGDTQAGLKGMSAEVAEAVLPRLRRPGFGFDCELLTACARLGVPVTEVPVHVRYESAQSSTNWRTTVRMLGELFQIRRDWRSAMPAARPTPVPERARAA